MPNWFTTRLTIYGTRDEAVALRALMKTSSQSFDFEALLPIPDDLRGIPHSAERAFELVHGDWEQHVPGGPDKPKTRGEAIRAARFLPSFRAAPYYAEPNLEDCDLPPIIYSRPFSFAEALALAQKAVERFGYPTAWAWCHAHWGVEQNCTDCYWIDPDAKEDLAHFIRRYGSNPNIAHDGVSAVEIDTAWAPPIPFMEALSRRFPSLTLKVSVSSFDAGWGGSCVLRNGVMTEEQTFDYAADTMEAESPRSTPVLASCPADNDVPWWD
jgi:hypothetical protein